MSFWLVLPIGFIMAALAGVLLGVPVLRMRGDYLAIVTLGFGEIIRILSKSDVLLDFTGGTTRHPKRRASNAVWERHRQRILFHVHHPDWHPAGDICHAAGWKALVWAGPGAPCARMSELPKPWASTPCNTSCWHLRRAPPFARVGRRDLCLTKLFYRTRRLRLVGCPSTCWPWSSWGGMGSIPGVIMGALVLKGCAREYCGSWRITECWPLGGAAGGDDDSSPAGIVAILTAATGTCQGARNGRARIVWRSRRERDSP